MSNLKVPFCCSTMTNEDYHGSWGYSRSSLMEFDISPYNYWAKYLAPGAPSREIKTEATMFGNAFHTLILEPHKFTDEFYIAPARVLLKDVGREIYDNYKNEIEKNEHKKLISREDWQILCAMEDRLKNHQAIELIEKGRYENSFFWEDKDSKLILKARPDILHKNMIIDLKTCADASPKAFQSSMVKYGYHVQGAMIRDAVEIVEGRRIDTVINICIKTSYPYNIGIYIIDEDALNSAQEKYKQLCVDLRNAIETGDFPDFGVHTIGLPKWAL